jgi:signal transduction histidine kinase/ligand-binding sensor domain-containing protein
MPANFTHTGRRGLLWLSLCLCVFSAGPATLQSRGQTSQPSNSTSSQHRWGSVTLFHGLPSDHVRAITQQPDGAMLFGTDEGLARYDGRRVSRLGNDGVAASRIRSLQRDGDSTWIGTDSGAALLVRNQLEPIGETSRYSVASILVSEGRVTLATDQGSIFFVDGPAPRRVVRITPDEHPLLSVEPKTGGREPLQLTSLATTGAALIIGTRSRGLLSVDGSELPTIVEVASHPRPFFVQAIVRDGSGRFWIGAETSQSDSGLYYAESLLHPSKVGGVIGTVTSLAFDSEGDLWAGTDSHGVFRLRDGRMIDHFTFENTAGGLRSNKVYSSFVDREGVIWFGTDRGVSRYDPQGLSVQLLSANGESNVVRALFKSSDGLLWCGTNNGLFYRGDESHWLEVREIGPRTVHAICEEPGGRILVGTAAGLFASSPFTKKRGVPGRPGADQFSRIESEAAATGDNVRAICTFRGRIYLAVFGRGLETLDAGNRMLVWPDASSLGPEVQVVSLYSDKDERLWIGTANRGAFVFDGKQVSVAPAVEALRDASIWSIDGTTDGSLYIAASRGLFQFASGKLISLVEGCDARAIICTSSDHSDDVWCATSNSGVFRVRVTSQPATSQGESPPMILSSKLDAERGLPSQSAFALLAGRHASSIELLIGTSRGIAVCSPSTAPPQLILTRAMARRVYSSEEALAGLNLEYPQNSVAIDVSASSSRTYPEQFQYSFYVADSRGRPVQSRVSRDSQLSLEGLKPDTYTVSARAFDVDLVESEPIVLRVSIAGAPFPWTSTALAVLLLMATIALFWGWRQNTRLVGVNRDLAETRLQLANETETERRRIARDLHDQTLADLRRLMMMSDQLPSSNGHSVESADPKKFRQEIESVSTEIRRICEDLSPSALANVGLAAGLEWAVAESVAHLPRERRFECEFSCDERVDSLLTPAEQIHLYRIVQEALSNVVRHSGASRLQLAVSTLADKTLTLEVRDNGRGFDGARAGRGITNIRSRASLINAEVLWTKGSDGKGTTLTLRRSQNRATDPFSHSS